MQIFLSVLILGAVFVAVLAVSVMVALRGLTSATDSQPSASNRVAGREGLIARVAFLALLFLVGGVSLGLVGAG